MTSEEVRAAIAGGESGRTAFCPAPGDGLAKAVAALANAGGGTVLLGVSPDGTVRGAPDGEPAAGLAAKLGLRCSAERVELDAGAVVVIDIPRAPVPVPLNGVYWERTGRRVSAMTLERVRAAALRGSTWDALPAERTDDLDEEALRSFVGRAVGTGRLGGVSPAEPVAEILGKLGLLSDGAPVNAAVLLFGRDPARGRPGASVRIGRFSSETEPTDDKWVGGNLFAQLAGTMDVLRRTLSVRYEIAAAERTDVWEYPLPALREAVTNALVHREYADTANFTQIKIHGDRLWINNPGRLPPGLSVDDLKRPHRSSLRNPLIARMFYLSGYVEEFGSGTLRIVSLLHEAGLPEPDFREEMGGFSVYFYRDHFTEESLRKAGLSPRQTAAVLYAKEHGGITNRQYQELNGVSNKTAYLELMDLCKKEVLKYEGVGRALTYVLRVTKR